MIHKSSLLLISKAPKDIKTAALNFVSGTHPNKYARSAVLLNYCVTAVSVNPCTVQPTA
jgi:hypothetical protein